MTARKQELIELLEQQAKAKRENRLKSWKPYTKQEEFIAATRQYTEVALRAGNQQGKSETAAYFVAVAATGLYPDGWQGRRWDKPVRIWACGESTTAVRDVNQRKLCGPPGDESLLGTGFIPRSCIVKTIVGHGAGGALDKVLVKHVSGGISEITFKTYEMERSKFQGESLDLVWMDEESPEDIYMEGLARTVATAGLVISTFTPLNGMLRVLPRFQERSAEAMRSRCLVAMRMSDALHLQDPDRQRALLATFPEYQKRARIEGLPLMGSGSVFEGIELESLLTPLRVQGNEVLHGTIGPIRTHTWRFLWGIDFGIDHPFAAVLIAHDPEHDAVYVLHDIKMRNATPGQHAARMKAVAANVKISWPHDGNSRDRGSGEQLADIYKREGLLMLPSHATFAKGGYSTEAGIAEMLVRMQTDRFKVAESCRDWHEEFVQYHRKEGVIQKINDDLMSATRIAVMQLRSAKPTALGSQRANSGGSGPQMAIGWDDPPF